MPNTKRAYLVALLVLVVAVALQWAWRPLLGSRIPFLFFLPAIGIAAMLCGWRPALLVFLGGFVNTVFWLQSAGDPTIGLPSLGVALIALAFSGGLLLVMGGWLSQLRVRTMAAEADLAQQLKDMQVLHELSQRINLLPNLHDQLNSMLKCMCELLHADKAIAWIADGESARLHVGASTGYSQETLDALRSIRMENTPMGLAFRQNRAVVVENALDDPIFADFRHLAEQEHVASLHCRPVHSREGKMLGVVSVSFIKRKIPGERENRLGDLVASFAGVLIERDAALREAARKARKLEVALESSDVSFALLQPALDDAGAVTEFIWAYVNPAAARSMMREQHEILGRPIDTPVAPAKVIDPDLRKQYIMAVDSGQTREFEAWVDFEDGTRRWFQIIASPWEEGLAAWWSDITARKQHEQAMREADRRKDEFLATLAHELRNPLAPIRQAARIARSPSANEQQKQWSYEVIERQVSHMAVMLDDLLDVSRITRGKLQLRRAPTQVLQIVQTAIESARPLAEAREQRVQTHLPTEPIWLEADEMRLSQVLTNLLTNAIKFSPTGGVIELAARREKDEAVFEVKDQGMGIAPEAIDQIFDMFTQVGSAPGSTPAGLGIGLALSRGLVQMHGGQLLAKSEGLGRGSTFTVRLPLAPAPGGVAAPPSETPQGLQPRRVLVADDNRDAAQSLAELLRMHGHDVSVAFDGTEALALYDRIQPDVALLDIGMPGLSGNEVARAIRGRPQGASTVLVAITGWGQERDRNAAHDAGFNYHFTKPVNPEQVLNLMDESLTSPSSS